MRVALSVVLPQSDPYSLDASVATSEFFTSDATGQQVVDWIWVELRSVQSTPVAKTAALLLSDDSVKASDATTERSGSWRAMATATVRDGDNTPG